MAKKTKKIKQLHPVDTITQDVCNNAVGYKVVMFRPGSSIRDTATFANFDPALDYAKTSIKNDETYRCAMIYVFDDIEKYILHGTINRGKDYIQYV